MNSPLPQAWASLHPQLESLPPKAQELLIGCYQAAVELVAARGYGAIPTEVAWFCPVTALAQSLGVKHNTVVTWFKRYPVLQQVLTYAPYSCDIWDSRIQNVKRWHAGAVWVIALRQPRTVRMRDEYLKHPWRDLQADIKAKNTLRQSSDLPTSTKDTIHYWSPVSPVSQTPSGLDCRNLESPQEVLHSVHDGPSLDQVARMLATWLADRSINCWRKVLWTVLRLNRIAHFTDMVMRVLTDVREWPGLRNPAALLVSRCRQAGYLA